MGEKLIRVLVVDDSALIRQMISDAIVAAPNMELAGTASSGEAAIRKTAELKPDCVTLDVQMPGMSGLEALPKILETLPVPVVVASATTTSGAETTLDALDHGAMDYVAKTNDIKRVCGTWIDELLIKVRNVAGTDVAQIMRIRKTRARRKTRESGSITTGTASPKSDPFKGALVVIGISTGGPPALARLFEEFEPPLPPIAIVQHMPADFTGAFARRLNSISALSVKEAESGDHLLPDHAYVAPGGKHMSVRRIGPLGKLTINQGEPISGHQPSVDCLFASAAKSYGKKCLGIIMTGMGHDGADGCRDIRSQGGFVLGQDEATSDVYGMNKVAFNGGHVDCQFSLSELPALLEKTCRRRFSEPRVHVAS